MLSPSCRRRRSPFRRGPVNAIDSVKFGPPIWPRSGRLRGLMKLRMAAAAVVGALIALAGAASAQPAARPWYKSNWDAARAKPCDRACLVGHMDRYVRALMSHDPSGLPLAEE